MSQPLHNEKPRRDTAEWDAEIEAEFQRTVQGANSGSTTTGSKPWRRDHTQVPRAWELRLLGATRISTYKLALELLYADWRAKGGPILVTSRVAKAVKLSPRSKWRALAELERLGLIEITRGPRKSPRVTLRLVPRQSKGL